MAANTTNNRRSTRRQNTVSVPAEDAYGHVQPQNLEMERAVLGALMLEQDAYSLISEILRPESFYDTRHQIIYRSLHTA